MSGDARCRKAVAELLADALSRVIFARERHCPDCGAPVEGRKYFCSPRCYARYHRIPGQVRKLLARGKRIRRVA